MHNMRLSIQRATAIAQGAARTHHSKFPAAQKMDKPRGFLKESKL